MTFDLDRGEEGQLALYVASCPWLSSAYDVRVRFSVHVNPQMLVEGFYFLGVLHSQGGHLLQRKATRAAASSWCLFLELTFSSEVFGTRECHRWGVSARAFPAYPVRRRPAVRSGLRGVGRRLGLRDGLGSVGGGFRLGGYLRCIGQGPALRGSLGGIGQWGECLERWPARGPEDGEVRLPKVGDLRQAVSRWGSWRLDGPGDLDLGILDRLRQAARATEVKDGA